jgi:DNA-binding transcriptional ArsR family regulator
MKIMKLLVQMGELNVSQIARRLKVNYSAISRHLKVLEDEGLIQCKTYGRIRLYRFNERSGKAKAAQNLIETWEQAEKSG